MAPAEGQCLLRIGLFVEDRTDACPHAQVQVGENGCSKEYIWEDVLNGVVWNSIKTLLAAADEAKEQVKQKQLEADQNNTKLVKKLAKLQKDREKCDAERFANVNQFMAGTLDKEVYQSRRADLTRKADRLDAEIAELEAKYHEADHLVFLKNNSEIIKKKSKFFCYSISWVLYVRR